MINRNRNLMDCFIRREWEKEREEIKRRRDKEEERKGCVCVWKLQ